MSASQNSEPQSVARFPRLTIVLLALGFVTTQILASRIERDPLAALPKLGVVPPVPGSLAWPTPLLTKRQAGEERVFFVGASETVAMPYQPAGHFGYGYQLGAGLAAATGRKDLHVRAEGGIALDSPQLVEQARKLLQYGDPSALVLVVGGNEFLNRLPLGEAMRADGILGRVGEAASLSVRAIEDGVAALREQPWAGPLFARFAPTADGGDLQGFVALTRKARPGAPAIRGLPIGARDRELLLGRMRTSARTLAQECAAQGVRFALALAPHGFDVQAPWCSRTASSPSLGDEAELEIDRVLGDNFRAPLADVDATLLPEIDEWIAALPERAELRHARARVLRKLGRIDEARIAFENALDLDLAPLHRLRAVRARLTQVAGELGVPLLLLEEGMLGEDGLVDPSLFLDYAHPTLEGHRRIAAWLARTKLAELLPSLDGETRDEAWWARFDGGAAALAAQVEPASVRRASAVMLATVASYYLCFGNFREALPALEEAVRIYGDEESAQAERARASLAFCREALVKARGER